MTFNNKKLILKKAHNQLQDMYEPIAKIAGEITSMNVPRPVPMSAKFDLSRLKDGGIASINYATRPLNAER